MGKMKELMEIYQNNGLDNGLNEFWAITIQIPSFKKLSHNAIYKAYSLFTKDEQKEIIHNYVMQSRNISGIKEDMPLFFEEHKDGRIHCHSYVSLTYDNIYNLQQVFCKELIKIRPKQFQQVFNIFRPDSPENWRKYCKKSSGNTIQLDYDLLDE